jgi:hypothetical protein
MLNQIEIEAPSLWKIIQTLLAIEPRQEKALLLRLESENDLLFMDNIALKILQISDGDVRQLCRDYVELRAVVMREEIFFRRQGKYRLSSFEDAAAQVYSDSTFMAMYMNALLLTQLLWRNHTEVLKYYQSSFVEGIDPSKLHLEIGPGHGLLLCLALERHSSLKSVGWDVSAESIRQTSDALAKGALKTRFGVNKLVRRSGGEVWIDCLFGSFRASRPPCPCFVKNL